MASKDAHVEQRPVLRRRRWHTAIVETAFEPSEPAAANTAIEAAQQQAMIVRWRRRSRA